MPAVRRLRCPECSAALKPPAPGQSEVKCEYCSVVARIPVGRTQQLKAVLQTAAAHKPVQPYAKPATWIVIAILASFVLPFVLGILGTIIAVVVALTTGSPIDSSSTSRSLTTLFDPSMQWSGQKAAMLYDVNRDGITDPIGHVQFIGADTQLTHLAAFDAVTGKRLWMTEPIADLSSGHEVKAAIAQDTLLLVDNTGVLKGYSVLTGQMLWSAPLGERAEWICSPVAGLATVELTDNRLVNVQLATGQISPGGMGDDSLPCLGVWSDTPGVTPTVRVESWRGKPRRDMPKVPGMHVDKLVRDPASGVLVALGYKTPGTRVPAAASIVESMTMTTPTGKARKSNPTRKARVDTRWLSNVPIQNPLKVDEGEPSTGTLAVGRLIVPYKMNGSPSSQRLACLDLGSGRSLWDVEIPQSDTGDVTAVVANDRLVFVSMWTYLHIFDLATGAHRTTIGKWM